jgi:hypothetical protein
MSLKAIQTAACVNSPLVFMLSSSLWSASSILFNLRVLKDIGLFPGFGDYKHSCEHLCNVQISCEHKFPFL